MIILLEQTKFINANKLEIKPPMERKLPIKRFNTRFIKQHVYTATIRTKTSSVKNFLHFNRLSALKNKLATQSRNQPNDSFGRSTRNIDRQFERKRYTSRRTYSTTTTTTATTDEVTTTTTFENE